MRVLFDHPLPFSLTHGGFQIQIEQTKAGLEQAGVTVDHLRWWDDAQRADIIHYFGRPSSIYIELAHTRRCRVVIEELQTALGSRSTAARFIQKILMKFTAAVLPRAFAARLAWEAFRAADAVIANTSWEAELMATMFGARRDRLHVLPNGVEEIFLQSKAEPRGAWLVCAATIAPRKRVVELAESALQASVPILFVGKPYSEDDAYAKRFAGLARSNPDVIRWEGAIADRNQLAVIYRQSRGFVLLSAMETRSLAAEEAAACECPLLLSDLPWARSVFGQHSQYCSVAGTKYTARVLREFYDCAPGLPAPPRPLTWRQVGEQLRGIYERVLNTAP